MNATTGSVSGLEAEHENVSSKESGQPSPELLRSLLRIKPFYIPRALDLTKGNTARVFIRDVAQGAFSLIYVNQFASERGAHVWPITKAIRLYDGYKKKTEDTEFIGNFEFLFATSRRVSKEQNEPLYILDDDSIRGQFMNSPILQLYFVTTVIDKSIQKKKSMLELVAEVSRSDRITIVTT